MKKLKGILGVFLTLVMVFSLTVTAFAEENKPYEITVNSTDTHEYAVYQIFTGKYSPKSLNLTDVKWGQNSKRPEGTAVGGEVDVTILSDLAKVAQGTNYTNAQKLEEIKKYVDLDGAPCGTVSATKSLRVDGGFYLFKDLGAVGDGDAYSNYIVMIGGNITINTKKKVPTVEKKVLEINDSEAPEKTGHWYDGADYDIGDTVQFKLTANLPGNISAFKSYKVVFNDTLSKGFTFGRVVSITLKTLTREVAESEGNIDIKDKFTENVTGGEKGQPTNFTLTCNDVKSLGATDNSIIEVIYEAKLNNDAVIGPAGNPNDVFLEYSNNPNTDGMGKTEKDLVKVFTYQLKVIKNDQTGAPLAGAGFTLYKLDVNGKELYEVDCPEATGDNKNEFEWKGLDSGNYLLRETTVPDGYNSIPDATFTIKGSYNIVDKDPKFIDLEVTNKTSDRDPIIDKDNNLIITTITNNHGSTLPTTGGIGTTIFHVGGTILVVGTAILLVVRKKMSEEK